MLLRRMLRKTRLVWYSGIVVSCGQFCADRGNTGNGLFEAKVMDLGKLQPYDGDVSELREVANGPEALEALSGRAYQQSKGEQSRSTADHSGSGNCLVAFTQQDGRTESLPIHPAICLMPAEMPVRR